MTEIVIYTKSYCPYCVKAKQLFSIKNLAFTEIDITNDQEKLEEMLKKSGGRRTVPQIFIGATHIGGCDDLYALHEKGELEKILLS